MQSGDLLSSERLQLKRYKGIVTIFRPDLTIHPSGAAGWCQETFHLCNNIGKAHAMGTQPITFIRQVLALITHPIHQFPEDAMSRARAIVAGCKGGSVGSYSDSPGLEVIGRHVAEYIMERDGGIESDWRNIILCAGASEVSTYDPLTLLSQPIPSILRVSVAA